MGMFLSNRLWTSMTENLSLRQIEKEAFGVGKRFPQQHAKVVTTKLATTIATQ